MYCSAAVHDWRGQREAGISDQTPRHWPPVAGAARRSHGNRIHPRGQGQPSPCVCSWSSNNYQWSRDAIYYTRFRPILCFLSPFAKKISLDSSNVCGLIIVWAVPPCCGWLFQGGSDADLSKGKDLKCNKKQLIIFLGQQIYLHMSWQLEQQESVHSYSRRPVNWTTI